MTDKKNYKKIKDSPYRNLTKDALYLTKNRKLITVISQVDITEAREMLQVLRRKYKKKISFYTYAIYCAGKTYEIVPRMAAVKGLWNNLYFLNNLSALLPLETKFENDHILVPKFIQNFNNKSIFEIQEAIDSFDGNKFLQEPNIRLFVRIPKIYRMLYYKILKFFPILYSKVMGNTMIVNDGAFTTDFWGYGIPYHTSGVFLGSFMNRVVKKGKEFEERKFVNLTVICDHLVADGSHLSKYMHELKKNLQFAHKDILKEFENGEENSNAE
ncbi:MAG: 2-oxo acid dehydrogenase subunit E2 [Melioribacteraceae bacterium]|nr:2-oxo acid dehydrogenase subunit E2 [Melioribacteraceae bacterium]MCF8265378.1 2-oxo acid dehydrogenase subunit E2 [Melioribacteraceae bacterium]MCF8412282.1 2-oxo acid dehydrogenase subunit E2 [Melioribacteraceae bacterium]